MSLFYFSEAKKRFTRMMKKILVIEDEPQIRSNIEEILSLTGFNVVAAENGQGGLQVVKTKLPDLILCDVMMPGMDGYTVLASLRQSPDTALIPIIFLTAKADRADQRYGMNLGADDYLTKPFTAEELVHTINARFERQELLTQQYEKERQQNRALKQEVQKSQQKLTESQQIASVKAELLQKLSQDLRNPLSNINMAIHMLRQVTSDDDRDRYLAVLQRECAREIELLNEIDNLQKLLTPENTQLLRRFNLLGS